VTNVSLLQHLFEWLADFQSKAKQRLGCATQDFKMPKTPAAKRTRKQKKRVFQQEDGNAITKKRLIQQSLRTN
jgi:hypothetical protein